MIADGLNYIKGFRYQMFCEAKALRTPSCVLQIATPVEKCRELNERALNTTEGGKEGYERDIFENLVFRYEEPNGMARWDSPLFAVAWEDEKPPVEAIWEAVVGRDGKAARGVRPNAATVLQPAREADFLYELDRVTSEVVGAIGAWERDHAGEGGGEVRVPGCEKVVELPMAVPSLPQLQRLRRQFVNLNRTQNALGKGRVRELFVDYLNDSFSK